MHSKNVIWLLLGASALVVAGCGSEDRSFVDNSLPDSSTKDAPVTSSDAGGDPSTTVDAPSSDTPAVDVPSADGRDAISSIDADATTTDGGRDVAADSTIDRLPPDAVADATNDGSDASWNDASDASDATYEVDCTSTPAPTISSSGSGTICPGKTVTLTSSASAGYLWSTSATTQSILVNTAGSYSVTTTDNRGCMATSIPTVISSYPAPTVPTITAGGPVSFCSGGSVTLTASSAGGYLWSTGATTQSIVVNDTGSYTVTTTNANGCDATSAPTNVTRIVPTAGSATFNYTGGVQSFTVPECVTSISVDAYGAQGGNGTYYTGGLGGRVQATLAVVANSSLSIRIGGAGGGSCPTGGLPGYNGGGQGTCNANSDSAAGGGATDIRVTPFAIGNRIVVAGAGGGAGFNCGTTTGKPDNGGAGGGLTGQKYPSLCTPATAGDGGSQVAGGAGGVSGSYVAYAGTLGTGGAGSPNDGTTAPTEGGGGGGGYYGGGGGIYGGGGGGSSFVTPTGSSAITHTQGVRAGHGTLIITW